MYGPVMVALVLAVLGTLVAGVTIYLTITRRKGILLMPLVDKRRLRR